MNKTLKKSFATTGNILLILTLALMVFAVYFKNIFYLSVGAISLCAVGILATIFGIEKITVPKIFKELNIYFFLVVALISFSALLDHKILFYIGLALLLMMILLYFILLFLEEKKQKRFKR